MSTPKIEKEYKNLVDYVDLYWRRKITEGQFLAGLDLYFQVVYDETLVDFERRLEVNRPVINKYEPLPDGMDTVDLHKGKSERGTCELSFISDRWKSWEAIEGRWDYFEDFHNDFPDQNYDHHKFEIRDPAYVLNWGMYGPSKVKGQGRETGMTIGAVISFAPQWLLWAYENTKKLPLSEQLLEDVQKSIAQIELSKIRRKDDRNN